MAPSPGGHGAAPGPRAPLDAHRGEQLGVGAVLPGEIQRGAADVLCCSHRGGWMVLHFVLGKVGKMQGNNNQIFRSSQTLPSDSFMQLFIIVAGFFVCTICTCFCFPHLLTMCPPSAKSHEGIV